MENDPYRYFRVEGRELLEGLSQGVLLLERGPQPAEVVTRLLRLAHTLKGAARVVRQPGLATLAHAAEGILAAHREGKGPLTKEQSGELLRLLDEGAAQLSALDAPAAPVVAPEAAQAPARPVAPAPPETLRVDLRELDALLGAASEAGVRAAAVRRGLGASQGLEHLAARLTFELAALHPGAAGGEPAGLLRARALAGELREGLLHLRRGVGVDLARVESGLGGLGEAAHRLRLVPAQSLFGALERAVRDAAEALGKPVSFEATGGAVRLDGSVLPAVRDALAQVVRNAVAHGLEGGADAAAERSASGKAPGGTVRLAVERRGGRVAFVCSDDGRGIDLEAVRRAAVARGLVTAAEAGALSADAVLALLGGGGLTTSATPTQLSGRGIGLELVRATVARLHGELLIRSAPGQGTTLTLLVPVAIASLQGLLVEVAGAQVAIPLDAVVQTLRLSEADLNRSAELDSILFEGRLIPFAPLGGLLQHGAWEQAGPGGERRGHFPAVVVRASPRAGEGGEARCAALGVDRLLGFATIVVRPVPALVEADPAVAGVWLDAEGNPQLVLDPQGLVAAAGRSRSAPEAPAAVAVREPILVIDDSLTTRMLEQSILESAGYEVEVASSAEEGLGKARARPHCLFIVDVEMPGMSGFEFVALTRRDPALRQVPAILVTSLSGDDDRRRGAEAGARAFIVKGEFDQGHLLDVIRALIGTTP
jgi:two-component system chemotaxis sensor kinase CheA